GRPGIFLAGDWTKTGWPSTMEGAVRSGLLAASSITERVNLEPDLPADGIMPWILGNF
ncbi:MAG: FAD-dependent oxidoreductase, partial [Acidobacteriales bacterium]|nr:FAD-dependent oxidoreductase [Terriglobales bacterium]